MEFRGSTEVETEGLRRVWLIPPSEKDVGSHFDFLNQTRSKGKPHRRGQWHYPLVWYAMCVVLLLLFPVLTYGWHFGGFLLPSRFHLAVLWRLSS
ncbi:hypothetical protein ABIB68_004183 [Bradyrhizobium sp. F1.2.2]